MPANVIIILLINELHQMAGKIRENGRSSRLQTRRPGIYPQTYWTDETMAPLVWSAALEIGHNEIDNDHRAMVGLLNRLQEASERADRVATQAVLAELETLTRDHFAREEQLMLDIHYELLARHQKEHVHLFDEVRAQIEEMNEGIVSAAAIAGFIKRWLIDHVETSDRQLAAALARWRSSPL